MLIKKAKEFSQENKSFRHSIKQEIECFEITALQDKFEKTGQHTNNTEYWILPAVFYLISNLTKRESSYFSKRGYTFPITGFVELSKRPAHCLIKAIQEQNRRPPFFVVSYRADKSYCLEFLETREELQNLALFDDNLIFEKFDSFKSLKESVGIYVDDGDVSRARHNAQRSQE